MLRRSFRIMFALLVAALLAAPNLLSPCSVGWADVGELPEPGGIITPGDKTDEIRMASESVVFAVRTDDGTFAGEDTKYYAHVTADFMMQNLSSELVSKDLFFPFHSSLDLAGFEDPANSWGRQAKNVKVLVAGKEVNVSYTELTLSTQEKVVAVVFPVDFPAGGETAIQIQYDVRAVHEPKTPLLSFKYLMETGSHWAGTIGSGEVRFEFWRPIESKADLGTVNDFFDVRNGNLVWDFSDLEPDASHNVKVTFDPAQLSTAEKETAPASARELTVRAFIDGRSQLVIRGDRVYWHHLDFAAPGRWLDPDTQQAHDEPTYLNKVTWYPVWPDQPDKENRDCGCDSTATAGIPSLARENQTVTLGIEQARGQVTIVQQPEAGNDYALIVEFDDDAPGGADWYEVTLLYATSGPPPAIPAAHGQTVTTPLDTPADITVTASDPEGKPLTFSLVTRPAHGVLTGSLPSLVYRPDTGYAGPDAFTFKASDGQHDSDVAEISLLVGPPLEIPDDCTGPNLLHNGDFEAGFDGQGVGLGWGAFHTPGGAAYSFSDDTWAPAVFEGAHSQLIALSTTAVPAAADRFAGLYQTVTDLEPGVAYELSIGGLMREEAAHPEDPYRYLVQWAYSSQGHQDWTQIAGWQDLPWHEIALRTKPGDFSTYTAHLVAPSQPLTLFIRVWKKWATSGRELDVNLDAITLHRCGPASVVAASVPPIQAATEATAWQPQSPPVAPSERCCLGLVYDSARQVIVAVGGGNWTQLSNETWEYDGTNWVLRSDLPEQAPVRWTMAAAYNPDDRATILFGGRDESTFYNDTWQYDGRTWVRIDALTPPSPRNGAKMAYDRNRQRMVLFGGYYGPGNLFFDETWEYEDGQWIQRFPAHRPPARESSAMVYDARRGVVVLFGGGQAAGSTVYGDTWEWDGNDWIQRLDLPTSPPARWAHAMAYDDVRQRTVLFGGLTGTTAAFDDTWEYNGQTWTQVMVSPRPSARWDPGLAYDLLNRRLVLFGGMDWDGDFGWVDDTWHYGAQ